MLVKDFTYHLPQDLIARQPPEKRDGSRLMLLDRSSGSIAEDTFCNLQVYLRPGDLLVMNDTRVIPARLFGRKPTGGRVEIFLLRRLTGGEERWECLLRSSKKFQEGHEILLESGMTAVVLSRCVSENWLVEFTGKEPFDAWLEREGHIPLPPIFSVMTALVTVSGIKRLSHGSRVRLQHRPPVFTLHTSCWPGWHRTVLKPPFLRCIPGWVPFSRCALLMLRIIGYTRNVMSFRPIRLRRLTGRKQRVVG